jgi:hypothetical protein
MRGIHRERESFRIRKRRTTAAAKAMMKMQQQQLNLECLNAVQQVEEPEEDNEVNSEETTQSFDANEEAVDELVEW